MADNQRMSKAEIAVLLTLIFISLCVALYNAWITPLAAFAVLLILLPIGESAEIGTNDNEAGLI